MAPKTIAPPTDDALRQTYLEEGLGCHLIGRRMGVSYSTARKWVINASISLRPRSSRTYDIAHTLEFFSTPSPDLWYVLGLLFADGCLAGKSYLVSLSNKSGAFLRRVASVIGFPGWPRSAGKGVSILRIYSKPVYRQMLGFGLTPRKSLTMRFPDVPRRFLGDFVRGYFDGDGSVGLKNLRSFPPSICTRFTSGSRPFLETLGDLLAQRGVKPIYLYDPKEHAAELSITHRDANLALVNLMYGNHPAIFMEHKWQRYAMFLAWSGLVCPETLGL